MAHFPIQFANVGNGEKVKKRKHAGSTGRNLPNGLSTETPLTYIHTYIHTHTHTPASSAWEEGRRSSSATKRSRPTLPHRRRHQHHPCRREQKNAVPGVMLCALLLDDRLRTSRHSEHKRPWMRGLPTVACLIHSKQQSSGMQESFFRAPFVHQL